VKHRADCMTYGGLGNGPGNGSWGNGQGDGALYQTYGDGQGGSGDEGGGLGDHTQWQYEELESELEN